jgi:predicted transcriptional regulator of viral defense system
MVLVKTIAPSQRQKLLATLSARGMARLSELMREGITAATVSRLEHEGAVTRLSRGLYQLPTARLDPHHTLAEAAKLVPKGVICLVSALAYHGLTDRLPPRVWIAIGSKGWRPKFSQPPIRIAWFHPKFLSSGVETHKIEGVTIRIFRPAKTVVDLFRYRRRLGMDLAVEALTESLRQRKATPAEISRYAHEAGNSVSRIVGRYLETLRS